MLRSGWEVRAGEAAWTEDSLALEPIRGQGVTDFCLPLIFISLPDVDKLREIIRDMRTGNQNVERL